MKALTAYLAYVPFLGSDANPLVDPSALPEGGGVVVDIMSTFLPVAQASCASYCSSL